ncbi:MAG: sensor histidine kinase [Candidatus Cohnella colombiensis]|uniref:histidine kinase n=1 Tax=Candidatus Cohnella colombiensis TaxID=3121368 RepID=A0AA95EW71_9BACL|nr:MAG: sensor histidine kinase [Cohnella sp.]
MQNWNQVSRKNTGLSPYVWVVFYILPFYFVFRSSATHDIVIGISMIVVYFICYVLSFVSKGWLVYFWTTVQIAISCAMGVMFGYVYFSLFLAFFIGNLKNKSVFFTLYTVHIVSTFATVNYGLFMKNPFILQQLPFVFLSLIAAVLLPISTYNKNKEDKLQGQLEDANKRISELVKLEERQRIARDLHDTMGQKLSLIGLKSELAGKLLYKNPKQAAIEINDVRQTARTALKEVRELVTQMRGTNLEDELHRIKQILMAADIDFNITGEPKLINTSLIDEHVISMCIKEAVTNVVKHSHASSCSLVIEPRKNEIVVSISDNGIGIADSVRIFNSNGIRGMKERLEFVNGSLEVVSNQGTTVVIKVPNSYKQPEREESQ